MSSHAPPIAWPAPASDSARGRQAKGEPFRLLGSRRSLAGCVSPDCDVELNFSVWTTAEIGDLVRSRQKGDPDVYPAYARTRCHEHGNSGCWCIDFLRDVYGPGLEISNIEVLLAGGRICRRATASDGHVAGKALAIASEIVGYDIGNRIALRRCGGLFSIAIIDESQNRHS